MEAMRGHRRAGGGLLARSTLVVALVVPVVLLSGSGGGAAPPAGSEGDRYTPVIQSVFSTPRWFEGTDHRVHLVYELMLTNGFPVEVTVTSLEVLDGRGRTIAILSGADLTAAMTLMATPGVPATALPPSTVGMVWFDVPFDRRGQLPSSVRHRLNVQVPPGLPVPETITSTGAKAKVDLRPPVVLSPPVAGKQWAALGSCCDGPHRRSVQPVNGGLFLGQRFAIDFNQLTPDDRLRSGPGDKNASYPTYGQPIYAVADAKVAVAVDEFPDQVPNDPKPVTIEQADGNHVVLDLGDGRFAFYAHLKLGTVTVRAGQRVHRGDILGESGNSGSSTGPHLHFHVMDGPSAFTSDGLPYVFDRFQLTGITPPLDQIDLEGPDPIPIDTTDAGPRRNALPLGRDVVAFRG